jgi:hypothetical protein
MKKAKTEQASSASVNIKELRSRNTSEHNMGPAGYTVKLEQWEEEDRKLAATGIPNPMTPTLMIILRIGYEQGVS